jgi:hypothetical protein
LTLEVATAQAVVCSVRWLSVYAGAIQRERFGACAQETLRCVIAVD